jgi:hypothetical protein
MRTTLFVCLALAAVFLLSASPFATAQSTGMTREDSRVGQIFSDLEKRVIREVLAETGIVDADEKDDAAADRDEADKNKAGKGAGKNLRVDCRRGWRNATGSRRGSRSSWIATGVSRRDCSGVRCLRISKIGCRRDPIPSGSSSTMTWS